MSQKGCALFVALSSLATFAAMTESASGAAFHINFDEKPTGRIITNQYEASHGVTFSGDNYRPTGPDTLLIFKSDRTNTPDLDLEYPWPAGNLVGTHLDKILIIAEDLRDFDSNGLIDHPDDEADGGSMHLRFNQPMESFGFDLIDVELNPALDSIEFLFNGNSLKTISFDQFVNPASPYYDPTIVWADRSANRIQPLTIQKLGIRSFDAVTFRLPECAAIDNLTFSNQQNIPEPAASVLLLAALPALRLRRRRR
jgi:hypothetical protein